MKSSLVGAVDIGGTKVSVGLADTGGNVIIEQEFPTVKGMDGADQSLKRTVHILEEQCRTLHIKVEDLLGIGVVCAGPVNVKKGTIENPYTLPGWEGYPIVDNLKKSIRLPVVLENDANGALLGEILLKKLEKEKVLMITFGTGIGVACWERGNVYAEGDYHPEMGHIVIASYGENCYCRHKGCFESLCSGAALNERALRLGFRDFDHAYREYQENNTDADTFIRMVRTEMKAGMWNLNLIFKPDDIITRLLESEALWKRNSNLKYLLEIKTDNLLFPFRWQAGMTGSINRKMPELHGGWDSQNSHIRGTFTGHWLSAAAYTVEETKNSELLVRANDIVDELEKIQELNGGEWVFPIPPEYIYGVRDGRGYWAPFYVCHKVLMGLLDMYRILGNTKALEIVLHASGWFTKFLEETSRETLTRMMDQQETGGLMELWADLYSITRDPAHLALMRGFERPALFEPLLEGKDVLTNMHANTTIPEVHGAARAYEVTEEERYRKIAESYWACAVRNRGTFATGGQTSGEVWTPMNQQAARLGDMNQEHCTVYNMIRLAEYLYRWTGDSEYSDYIERNILNGLYAQGHWVSSTMDSICQPLIPERKLVTYYLPLKAGATKKWGTATENFWCCHCTLVQAHSRLREFIYHTQDSSVSVDQFIPSELRTHINGEEILLTQTETDLGGSCNQINNTAVNGYGRPKLWSRDIRITAEKPVAFTLKLRIPWWVKGAPVCYVDGIETPYEKKQGYAVLTGEWKHNIIRWVLPKAVTCWPLPDEPETVAFLDGPVVLAGLVGEERMLYGDIRKPEEFIKPANERLWNYWTGDYRTFNQPVGFYLRPISQIGDETYTVYFPVRPAK